MQSRFDVGSHDIRRLAIPRVGMNTVHEHNGSVICGQNGPSAQAQSVFDVVENKQCDVWET